MRPIIVSCLLLLLLASGLPGRAQHAPRQLFIEEDSSASRAAASLRGTSQLDAMRLARIPTAVWFASGTPAEVEASVRRLFERAARHERLPVLVAYNIPYRDCALYSAGGAADPGAYIAWIRGLAAGIGDRHAIVILEPDGLGVIPWHRTLAGDLESCRPQGQGEGAAGQRYAMLRQAVDILSRLPNVRLYLDGTGSSWLAPGEIAARLIKADVANTAGFFLNVSNFESDDRVVPYARWVSDCVVLVTRGGLDPRRCPSQYAPAQFDNSATWRATDRAYDRLFAAAGMKRDAARQLHAVIDTSRNGRGSWRAPAGKYRDAEIWCNPPARGLGRLPTLATGYAWIDAFLWIKIPGESDGECLRGTAGPQDPERGVRAPPAGQWFATQARELIENAKPRLPD